MKKIIIIILGIAALCLLAGFIAYTYFAPSLGPAILPPVQPVATTTPTTTNETGLPLKLDSGLSISTFASGLSGARDMAWDSNGNLWVSRTSDGIITRLTIVDGKVTTKTNVFTNLRKPHGLAFDPAQPSMLYVAEETKLWKIDISKSDSNPEVLTALPVGGRHFTRSLLFGADDKLYISIGSTCDACHEANSQNASVQVWTAEKGLQEFSKGLRNSVFMALQPVTKEIWATEMGRDLLGDNIPPDEINILKAGGNYGWPNCYGQNIHDDVFDKNTYIRNPCMQPFETPSTVDLQAHSAPLGLAFAPSDWPEGYRGDLFIAYHGSWNRSEPTGYKIVRYDLDAQGNLTNKQPHDVVSGWLDDNRSSGRPVDLEFHDKALYVSDDKAGVIYRIGI